MARDISVGRAIDPSETPQAWPPLPPRANVLMVWPRFPPSFWGFEGMMRIMPEKAIMPPLGLITLAALCPPHWRVRLIDCAFEPLTDRDILGADLVMVSAMHAQRADAHAVLNRCRQLGTRSIIGGPYASSQPEALLPLADHVVVGEVDGCFDQIAAGLEAGRAPRLYRVTEKPDITLSPIPRFDLLDLDAYASLSVQFSRGCPFECEFCDIITIYGRRPRTKLPAQLVTELDALRRLGWRKEVFVVDDNFIGNRKAALRLVREIAPWQRQHRYPFALYTEASLDLASQHELLAAMTEANFLHVFIGIETPSDASLREARKFQNLRQDSLQQIRTIQRSGLWITGGFIVGFDSDDERIFGRQIEFIERAAIPWALTGVLQAPPTTALFDRLLREGRLIEDSDATTNFSPPNFRTALPLDVLLDGLRQMLLELYEPSRFFRRAVRSLECWKPTGGQHPPRPPNWYRVRVGLSSLWHQGIRSPYRQHYWKFLATMVRRWRADPVRLWQATVLLLSAHHFLEYAKAAAEDLAQNRAAVTSMPSAKRTAPTGAARSLSSPAAARDADWASSAGSAGGTTRQQA
jgi:radical SAM superfamily enzyme YgiQ (UPF0313 family)